MHSAKRLKTLTGSATAKLTRDEEELVKKQAEQAGLTKSEWCRQVLLNALNSPPETHIMLSEFLALRTVVLALHTDLLKGQRLTDQRIAAVIQQADGKKHAMAENRIKAFQSRTCKTDGEETTAND